MVAVLTTWLSLWHMVNIVKQSQLCLGNKTTWFGLEKNIMFGLK